VGAPVDGGLGPWPHGPLINQAMEIYKVENAFWKCITAWHRENKYNQVKQIRRYLTSTALEKIVSTSLQLQHHLCLAQHAEVHPCGFGHSFNLLEMLACFKVKSPAKHMQCCFPRNQTSVLNKIMLALGQHRNCFPQSVLHQEGSLRTSCWGGVEKR